MEAHEIVTPEASLTIAVAFFFGVVVLMGLALFLIPVRLLKLVFKAMFTVMFIWGLFIPLGLTVPFPAAAGIAVAAGLVWLLRPTVWLHNALMSLALISAAAVFGLLLPPWTAMLLMLVISVYDVLAVRLGYMLWMAKSMSDTGALPAFVLPKTSSGWGQGLRGFSLSALAEREPEEREVSVLGGGDIGFPLLLTASVFFKSGLAGSLIVAGFSVLGLAGAYWLQHAFLKGKPMPALPPIALGCLTGFLIQYFLLG